MIRKTGAKLPRGYRIEWSGEFAQMQEANARLMIMVPLSIVLIMVLLSHHVVQLAQGCVARHGRRVDRGVWAESWTLRLTEDEFQHLQRWSGSSRSSGGGPERCCSSPTSIECAWMACGP